MNSEALTSRPIRAALAVVSFVWFMSIVRMGHSLYFEIVPVSVSCLEGQGLEIPVGVQRFFNVVRFMADYWLIVVVPLLILAILPKNAPFRYLPYALLVITALFQVAAAWATFDLSKSTVDCLVGILGSK